MIDLSVLKNKWISEFKKAGELEILQKMHIHVCIVFEAGNHSEGTEQVANNSSDKNEHLYKLSEDSETSLSCQASGHSPPSSSQNFETTALFNNYDKSCSTKSQHTQNLELKEIIHDNQWDGISPSVLPKNLTKTSKRNQYSTKSELSIVNSTLLSDLKNRNIHMHPSIRNSNVMKCQNGAYNTNENTSDKQEGTCNRFDIPKVDGTDKSYDQKSCISCDALPSNNGVGVDEEDWDSVSPNLQPNESIYYSCQNRLVGLNDVKKKSNIKENISDASTEQIKMPLLIRNIFKTDSSTSSSFEREKCEDFNTNANKISSNGGSGAKPNLKQKLKKKFKKNKLKLPQKWTLFPNYFRSDPANFCHNFVPSNEICKISIAERCKSSNTATSSVVSRVLSSSCPNVFNKVSLKHTMEKKSKSSNTIHPRSGHSNSKDNNEDFYSYICDNQLSVNNSPCKSPRQLLGNSLESNIILLRNQNQKKMNSINGNYNVVIVSAKPVKNNSIGFNIEPQHNCFPEEIGDSTANDKKLYTFPDLNKEVATLDVQHKIGVLLPEY